jgi:hypothetical protein
MTENAIHFHQDEAGLFHRCYHKCKSALTSWQFWLGSVVSQFIWFPFEHSLWDNVGVLHEFAKIMGVH